MIKLEEVEWYSIRTIPELRILQFSNFMTDFDQILNLITCDIIFRTYLDKSVLYQVVTLFNSDNLMLFKFENPEGYIFFNMNKIQMTDLLKVINQVYRAAKLQSFW